ncbi:CASR protein, partial [Polypterus senegalus]
MEKFAICPGSLLEDSSPTSLDNSGSISNLIDIVCSNPLPIHYGGRRSAAGQDSWEEDILFPISTGLGEITFKVDYVFLIFSLSCRFEVSVFQRVQAMIFAIEEINKDQTLLPNITLGYRLYDNCVNLPVALRATTALFAGMDDVIPDYSCNGPPPVIAIVGDPLSSHSIAALRIISLFRMPMVSYFATCSCLSNKREFPSFFRTIPSDAFQVKAMIQIIKHYGWVWIGAIASDDDYGQNAIKVFMEEVSTFGCIAFTETVPTVYKREKIIQIVNTVKQSTAKVIVVFSSEVEFNILAKEIVKQNITGRQWIASEAWSTSTAMAIAENFNSFGGTIGVAIRRGSIPGLEDFLLQVPPEFNPDKNLISEFWEALFECKFSQEKSELNSSSEFYSRTCTGFENIHAIKTAYSDVSNLRSSYNVYKAVYAIAHALHNLMSCENGNGPFENKSCADIKYVQPWQVLHYLKEVNFTSHLGERVAFDENGDAIAVYDIVNWQPSKDGGVLIKTIGLFDEMATEGQQVLLAEEDIFWNFESREPPESVCSKSCQPGTRKASRKGEPVCCFDCVPCADGEISSRIVKTIVVIMAFRATLPGNNMMKCGVLYVLAIQSDERIFPSNESNVPLPAGKQPGSTEASPNATSRY